MRPLPRISILPNLFKLYSMFHVVRCEKTCKPMCKFRSVKLLQKKEKIKSLSISSVALMPTAVLGPEVLVNSTCAISPSDIARILLKSSWTKSSTALSVPILLRHLFKLTFFEKGTPFALGTRFIPFHGYVTVFVLQYPLTYKILHA